MPRAIVRRPAEPKYPHTATRGDRLHPGDQYRMTLINCAALPRSVRSPGRVVPLPQDGSGSTILEQRRLPGGSSATGGSSAETTLGDAPDLPTPRMGGAIAGVATIGLNPWSACATRLSLGREARAASLDPCSAGQLAVELATTGGGSVVFPESTEGGVS